MATREGMIARLREMADALDRDVDYSNACTVFLVAATPDSTAAFGFAGADANLGDAIPLIGHLGLLQAKLLAALSANTDGADVICGPQRRA